MAASSPSHEQAKHIQLAVTPNALIQHNLRAQKAVPQYKSPETPNAKAILTNDR